MFKVCSYIDVKMKNLISDQEEEDRRLKALAEYRILGTKPESC